MESPDSILTQVNLRTLLNKGTFLRLPPSYQFRLAQLLPQVDLAGEGRSRTARLSQSSLNNEFFAKACQEWRDQLNRGELTLESILRSRADSERERSKLDPWKVKHFEPIWGVRKDYDLTCLSPDDTSMASIFKSSSDQGQRSSR